MPTNSAFDLLIIGAGPGGYVAAIRAAQLGMKVACIEKEPKLGGTCLRVGCIPSKALLDASEKFAHAGHQYKEMGIAFDNLRVDLPAMMARKSKVVDTMSGGVSFLFKKNNIASFQGSAKFISPTEVEITSAGGSQRLTAKSFIIATGRPVELPFLKYDGKRIINSDHAIALPEIPKKLVVIGAGAIGLELGFVWARLGSQVTVLEFLPGVVPGADKEMAGQLERTLKKQGLNFVFQAKVTGTKEADGKLQVVYSTPESPDAKTEPADVVLVSVGRRPYSDGLGAKEIGIKLDDRNRITVDAHYRTSVPNIYAIGDVIAGPMLAHKAEEEGIAVAELLAGKAGHVNYNAIPAVVYTSPEFAWVGLTEEQCTEQKIPYKTGKFKFAANGRAQAMNETDGQVKIIAHAQTDRILGVHIVGPQASAMIPEAVLALEFGASSEDLARTCHAHPTLPEAIKEAALAVEKRSIHSVN